MKSPAFSFYVRDWLCSKTVSKLHSKPCSKGVGAYVYLLCSAWLEDPGATLPSNDSELAGLARVSIEEWMDLKPSLMSQFKTLPSGRLYNERLMEEWEKQQKRKAAGGKGGSQKVANRVAKGVANRVAALEVENENENGSSDHYPEIPTVEEAITQTMTLAIPEDFCRYVYSKWAERQGKDGANVPVRWFDHVKGRWIREQVQWKNGTHRSAPAPSLQSFPPLDPEKYSVKIINGKRVVKDVILGHVIEGM